MVSEFPSQECDERTYHGDEAPGNHHEGVAKIIRLGYLHGPKDTADSRKTPCRFSIGSVGVDQSSDDLFICRIVEQSRQEVFFVDELRRIHQHHAD